VLLSESLASLLLALAALVTVGQTLARELFLAATDGATLRALGLTRPRRFLAVLLPVGLVSLLGGLVGAGLAILASPLTPIGVARRAEPDAGFVVNVLGLGLGLGVVATLATIMALASVPAWRLARAARAGMPPSSVAGLRMALERGRGATAVPVGTTLVGVAAGIVALAAAVTFTASLEHLLGTPRLYGWSFDAVAGDWSLADPSSRRPPELTANPHVGAFAAVHFHQVRVGGAPIYTASIDTAHGGVFPAMVEGREPRGPDEIALGTRTLRQLGLRLGQTVELQDRQSATMRIVAVRPACPARPTQRPPTVGS
jgi:hypothetical protein